MRLVVALVLPSLACLGLQAQAPPLHAGMHFTGQAVSTRSNRVWPAELLIVTLDGSGAMTGELAWPNLGSRHRIVGRYQNGVLEFKEVSAIQPGAAHLNVSYRATLRGSVLAGNWSDPTGDEGTLSVQGAQERVSADLLGSVWQESENGWSGVWTRRGASNVFDAAWTLNGQRAAATLTMAMTGPSTVSVHRQDIGNGNEFDYSGTVSADGSVTGTFRPQGGSPTYTWAARIQGRQQAPTGAAPAGGPEAVLFKLESLGGVSNGPSARTTFTLNQPSVITKIWTYHWNGSQGSSPGTIGLRNARTGQMVGTWAVTGTYHSFNNTPGAVWPQRGDGPPFLYWYVQPVVPVPAGIYEVVDSSPGTWSTNAEMRNMGCAWVFGHASGGPSPLPMPVALPPQGGRDFTSGGRDFTAGEDSGAPSPGAAMTVRITPLQQVILAGDKAVTNVVVRGGQQPYTYQWFNGNRLDKATAWSVTWAMGGPGPRDIRVVVADAAGVRVEAHAQVLVQ